MNYRKNRGYCVCKATYLRACLQRPQVALVVIRGPAALPTPPFGKTTIWSLIFPFRSLPHLGLSVTSFLSFLSPPSQSEASGGGAYFQRRGTL